MGKIIVNGKWRYLSSIAECHMLESKTSLSASSHHTYFLEGYMPNTITRSSKNSPLVAKETEQIILLLEENRQSLIDEWVETVRLEFDQPESTTDQQLADHMLYILDALIAEMKLFHSDPSRSKSYRQGNLRYDFGTIDDDKDGGEKHGRQRASINAYNADKVFWNMYCCEKLLCSFCRNVDYLI